MAEMEKPIPNRRLRYERERRGWSQQVVADKVGTTPLNVGRWERGVTLPGPHFRLKLSEIFEKSPVDLGLVTEQLPTTHSPEPTSVQTTLAPATESAAPFWNVPYRRNSFFTGREEVLEQLHTALTAQEQPIAISQPQAISGLGGIGKTQTAVEYAYRYRDDYTAVMWARAESPVLLVSDYLTIAALLNLPERNEQDQRKIVSAVLHWFDTHEGWLLVLDNADDLEMASAFIPASGKGHVLLTTRAHSTGTIAGRVELDTMTMEEGTLFLLRRIKRIRGNTSLESVPVSIRNLAWAIVEEVDALPLALDQVGAYIEETGTNLSDYLRLFRLRRQRLLRMRGQDAVGHPEPVATTWSLSVEKIKQANPAAAELLCLLALLHPDRIPESMIVAGASELGPVLQPVVSDEFDFNEALGELHKYSLIKRDPEDKILAIHRLVQTVIWDRMSEKERELWAERAVAALDVVFPELRRESTLDVWGECERLLPHVLSFVAGNFHLQQNLALASLMNKTAYYLVVRAQHEQAESLFLQALSVREQVLGPVHSDVANTLKNLADLYAHQDKFEQAETLLLRSLQIEEQALGPIHADLALTLNNLASLYRLLGKYEQAETLYLRALHIREQVRGLHPDVASSLNNLANLYTDQGKYQQAESLYLRSIDILEKVLGSQHPDIAYPMNNLADLYNIQGKYEQAEPLLKRALQIREEALGPLHPDVAYPLHNLAETFFNQGKYMQARSYYQRAMQVFEQAFGPQHSMIAYPLIGLANLYREQSEYEKSETLYQRALHNLEQGLGPEHPLVAIPLNGLANLYQEQGKYEQAEPLFLQALRIRQQQQGVQHPETAETLHDFACFYEVQHRLEEALALYRQALAIREQVLGPQHPHTIDTQTRTARLLRELGRTEEAAALEAAPAQPDKASDQPA